MVDERKNASDKDLPVNSVGHFLHSFSQLNLPPFFLSGFLFGSALHRIKW